MFEIGFVSVCGFPERGFYQDHFGSLRPKSEDAKILLDKRARFAECDTQKVAAAKPSKNNRRACSRTSQRFSCYK